MIDESFFKVRLLYFMSIASAPANEKERHTKIFTHDHSDESEELFLYYFFFQRIINDGTSEHERKKRQN
jgi:hypothetical protein